jgi:hypothetical protein
LGVVHLLVQFPFGLIPVADSSTQPQQLRCSIVKGSMVKWVVEINKVKLNFFFMLKFDDAML